MATKKLTTEEFWNNKAKTLVGKTIKGTRYMTDAEMNQFGWYKKPLIIVFTDNSYIIPQMDDEGNDGGAIYGSDDSLTFPTI
jgi:hypothetical protein